MGMDPAAAAESGVQEVLVAAGDVVSARMPEPAAGGWAGVPVISVRRAGESAEEIFDSRRVRVVAK
jgi:hypothetical protein